MKNSITEVFEILFSHKEEMEDFMDFYVFKKMGINKYSFMENKDDFCKFIEFCLNTAQKPSGGNIEERIEYFQLNYLQIKKMIDSREIEGLKKIIYESRGVGQKIGSMMLEFIYLYSNKRDVEIAKTLFIPLDTHVLRIFKDSFGLKNIPTNPYQLDVKHRKFIDFQESLKEYTNGRPIVYFDYLWFIGKIFCAKINEGNKMSRGYRLCNYCWIKDCCMNSQKWI